MGGGESAYLALALYGNAQPKKERPYSAAGKTLYEAPRGAGGRPRGTQKKLFFLWKNGQVRSEKDLATSRGGRKEKCGRNGRGGTLFFREVQNSFGGRDASQPSHGKKRVSGCKESERKDSDIFHILNQKECITIWIKDIPMLVTERGGGSWKEEVSRLLRSGKMGQGTSSLSSLA